MVAQIEREKEWDTFRCACPCACALKLDRMTVENLMLRLLLE
jgi:hypothetical protein